MDQAASPDQELLALKTQIWIAVSVYVLIAIVRRHLAIKTDFYRMLQVLSVMSFERSPLKQALELSEYGNQPHPLDNQLVLFAN